MINKHAFTYIGVVVGYITLSFIMREYIITLDHYYESLKEQLNYQRIDELLTLQSEWKWLGYVLMPLFLLLKFGVITITLLAGTFMLDIKVSIKKIFRVVVISEFVLLAAMITKISYFLFIPESYTLEDIQYFYPLSLLSLFDPSTLDTWWIYPLQILNLFEVIYWIVLAFLLGRVIDESFDRRLGMVLSSYGSGLLIWVIFITFITLNLS